jgi:putative nucleotidyltransferase with HDIG domain
MNESLKLQVQKITELPTLSVIAQEIMQMASNKLMSVEKLENIIHNDPAISAKILSVSNSAYFGFDTPTKTLSNAIMRVGFSNVKNIALGVSLMSVMKEEKPGTFFEYQQLFNHCISVGFVARKLAEDLKMRISEEIMIDGLLHDLGFLIINKYLTEAYSEVVSTFKKDKSLLDAEKKVLDFTHADVGAWLAEQWKLPENVIDTILFHHSPALASKNRKRVAIIHIADYLTANCIASPARSNPNYPFDKSSLEILGITESDMDALENKVSGGIFAE